MTSGAFINSAVSHTGKLNEAFSEEDDSDSGSRSNVFTIVASDGLMLTIRPALEHILWVLASRFPERLGNLYQISDEVILVIDLLIQQQYLSKYSALFAEHFYGMERNRVEEKRNLHFPSSKLIKKSLIFHVIAPYLKLKLDRFYHRLKEKYEETASSTLQNRLIKTYLLTYPYIHMLLEGSHVIFYLAYAVQKTPYSSLSTFLQGIRLHQLTGRRLAEMEIKERKSRDVLKSSTSIKDNANYIMNTISANVATTLTASFEVGAFFLQFLDWWYANAPSEVVDLTSLPIPPPPAKYYRFFQKEEDAATKCPVCKTRRKNETLVPISGFVYCYKCIVGHLRSNETQDSCPVTGLPVTEDDLIRIFPPGSE